MARVSGISVSRIPTNTPSRPESRISAIRWYVCRITRGRETYAKIILHHYALSPYSEKVRLALGLKGITWSSVDIPIWTPRPKLTPMTGGYRKPLFSRSEPNFTATPCTSFKPSRTWVSSGTLYPKGQEAMTKAFGWWIEKGSFFNAVCLTIGNMPGIPQELIDERRPLFRVNLDPGGLRPNARSTCRG